MNSNKTTSSQTFARGADKAEWMDPADVSEWDDFVSRHPLGHIYHLSTWRRVIEESFPHIRGKFLMIRDEATMKIRAGLPLYAVKSSLLGNRVVSVPFATFCDPLVSTREDMEVLLQAVMELSKVVEARRVEFRTRTSFRLLAHVDMSETVSFKHHFLKLEPDASELKKKLSRTAIRRMIATAEGLGITVEQANSQGELRDFYELLKCTRRRLGLPAIPLRFFNSLWERVSPEDCCLMLSKWKKKVVGATLGLKSKETFYLEYAGDLPELRGTGSGQLLYWETIKWATQRGCKVFSFGRTANANQSLLKYKAHWNTVEEDLSIFAFPNVRRTNFALEFSRTHGLFKAILSRTPSPFYDLIGQLCYRHWG